MKDNSVIVIVPARLASTRLPRKILLEIGNVPMIIRVLRRLQNLNYDICYAVDSEEVFKLITDNGGRAIMTDSNLDSGTDRIYQALLTIEKDHNYQYIINVQADMLNLNIQIVEDVVSALKNNPNIDIITPVYKITDNDEIRLPQCVKVVTSNTDSDQLLRAVYFSRSSIPYNSPLYYGHIGIYGYQLNALKKFVSCRQSYLEKIEKLEQLRALENGLSIYCVPVSDRPISIDTQEDVDNVYKNYDNLKDL